MIALRPLVLMLSLMLLAACASTPPSVGCGATDYSRWRQLPRAPADADQLLEIVSQQRTNAAQQTPASLRDYWYAGTDGSVLLCQQGAKPEQACWSERWAFGKRSGGWTVLESQQTSCAAR